MAITEEDIGLVAIYFFAVGIFFILSIFEIAQGDTIFGIVAGIFSCLFFLAGVFTGLGDGK